MILPNIKENSGRADHYKGNDKVIDVWEDKNWYCLGTEIRKQYRKRQKIHDDRQSVTSEKWLKINISGSYAKLDKEVSNFGNEEVTGSTPVNSFIFCKNYIQKEFSKKLADGTIEYIEKQFVDGVLSKQITRKVK